MHRRVVVLLLSAVLLLSTGCATPPTTLGRVRQGALLQSVGVVILSASAGATAAGGALAVTERGDGAPAAAALIVGMVLFSLGYWAADAGGDMIEHADRPQLSSERLGDRAP